MKFVGGLYGLDNEAAAYKVIEDFALPIRVFGLSYREKREREQKVRRCREIQDFVRYAEAVIRLYRIRLCKALRCPNTEHFAEALQLLSIVDYRLECLKECPQELFADKKVVKWIGAVEQRLIDWDTAVAERGAVPG